MKHFVIRERNNLIETIRSTVSDQLAIGRRRYRHSDESAAERAAIGFRGTIWPKTERRSVRLYPSVPLAVPGRLAVIFFTSLILLLLFLLFHRPLSTFAILVVPVSAGRWEKTLISLGWNGDTMCTSDLHARLLRPCHGTIVQLWFQRDIIRRSRRCGQLWMSRMSVRCLRRRTL